MRLTKRVTHFFYKYFQHLYMPEIEYELETLVLKYFTLSYLRPQDTLIFMVKFILLDKLLYSNGWGSNHLKNG
jgi:hypothetical protein